MEWQHHWNKLLGKFGLAIAWNKKNSPKNVCSHVIFIVFFFKKEIAGGDGINQFLLKTQNFLYRICLCSCRKKGHNFLLVTVHNEVDRWSVRAKGQSWNLGITNLRTVFNIKPKIGCKNFLKSTFSPNFCKKTIGRSITKCLLSYLS